MAGLAFDLSKAEYGLKAALEQPSRMLAVPPDTLKWLALRSSFLLWSSFALS